MSIVGFCGLDDFWPGTATASVEGGIAHFPPEHPPTPCGSLASPGGQLRQQQQQATTTTKQPHSSRILRHALNRPLNWLLAASCLLPACAWCSWLLATLSTNPKNQKEIKKKSAPQNNLGNPSSNTPPLVPASMQWARFEERLAAQKAGRDRLGPLDGSYTFSSSAAEAAKGSRLCFPEKWTSTSHRAIVLKEIDGDQMKRVRVYRWCRCPTGL